MPALSSRERPSVRIETTRWIELILTWKLPVTYPELCYKEIRVSQVLPSETLPKLWT